jgi:hypothetical protein
MNPPKKKKMRTTGMSDTEDYPGPTKDHPEKQGQDPSGRTKEKIAKPPTKPQGKPKKKKN